MEMTGELGLGKVTKEVFRRSVQPYMPMDEVELDGATVELTDHTVVAHSPSIGVPLEALGFFAFHYAAGNVASRFGKPTHVVAGIYLPLRTPEEHLRVIAKSLGDEARRYGVKISAGQTATYYGLEIPLVTATCFGEALRVRSEPEPGDAVAIIGEVGGEGAWLREVSAGAENDTWRSFTPLPAILALQGCPYVKLMHDVSEGGVKGCLYEVQDVYAVRMAVDSGSINYHEGIVAAGGDPLRAPSYGSLISIIDADGVGEVRRICEEQGIPFADAGRVEEGHGLYVDGIEVTEQRRVELDELYGSLKPKDTLLSSLKSALDSLIRIPRVERLLPQVGTNLVYAKEGAETAMDVAGLSGRVVASTGGALLCGETAYGASQHLASVVLEAEKKDSGVRSAINVKAGEDVATGLRRLGLSVVTIPSKVEGEGCPVTHYMRSHDELYDAYIHPGDFGVEPTTTILGESPETLVEILKELSKIA
jgi:predicted fused transcriptional regulator/phosphomethylpyrimidine kinase/hydrogenase maturation factor